MALALGGARLHAAPVTFNKQIAPLVFRHCAGCHRPGEVAPFPLLTYADVVKRAEQVEEIIVRGAMPPWKPRGEHAVFRNDRRLSADEIALVRRWVADGAPEGVAADLPAAPKFREGWQLGAPNLVVTVPEPIRVPAEGRDLHMNVVLPLAVPPGAYLKAAEFRPSNPRVVHHAVLYVDETGEAARLDAASHRQGFEAIAPPGKYLPGALGMWAPGRRPRPLGDGFAMTWPAGAALVLHLHLHPTGKPETERSSIGFYFTAEPPQRELVALTLVDTTIDIPPGKKDYRTHDRKVVAVDSDLMDVFPHMHMLGRKMEVTAQLPDGTRRSLLAIDDWDYNWQDFYEFAAPVRLPAGTVVTLDAEYDNSADNPQNPRNPPVRVRAGEGAEDEMSLAFLNLSPVAAAIGAGAAGRPADPARQQAQTAWRRADADGDRRLSEVEIYAAFGRRRSPDEIGQIVSRFDRNGDGRLNFEEFYAVWKTNSP